MLNEVGSLKQYFKEKHIVVSLPWLQRCINKCKEENRNVLLNELQNKAYQQWLYSDFRKTKPPPILQAEWKTATKITLTTPLTLQLMSIVDISQSKYSQIQKIRNNRVVIEEGSYNNNQQSVKRMLQLKLTDGVQEINAMEYKTVQCLNLDLLPGMKLRINTPVTIRRGQIMLEDGKVALLGGCIDNIVLSNCPENILAKALRLPINENVFGKPKISNSNVNDSQIAQNVTNQPTRVRVSDERQTTLQNARIPERIRAYDDMQSSSRISDERQSTIQNSRIPERVCAYGDIQPSNRINDERQPTMQNTRISADNIAGERASDDRQSAVRPARISTPEIVAETSRDGNNTTTLQSLNDDGFDDDEMRRAIEMSIRESQRVTENQHQNVRSKPQFEDFEVFDIDEMLALEDEFARDRQEEPQRVISIKDLLGKNCTEGDKYTINAQLKNVVEKFKCEPNEYRIKILVEDTSGEIAVNLNTDCVSKLIGLTPQELRSKRASVGLEEFTNILDNFRIKLLDLNSDMEVIFGADKQATVTSIHNLQ